MSMFEEKKEDSKTPKLDNFIKQSKLKFLLLKNKIKKKFQKNSEQESKNDDIKISNTNESSTNHTPNNNNDSDWVQISNNTLKCFCGHTLKLRKQFHKPCNICHHTIYKGFLYHCNKHENEFNICRNCYKKQKQQSNNNQITLQIEHKSNKSEQERKDYQYALQLQNEINGVNIKYGGNMYPGQYYNRSNSHYHRSNNNNRYVHYPNNNRLRSTMNYDHNRNTRNRRHSDININDARILEHERLLIYLNRLNRDDNFFILLNHLNQLAKMQDKGAKQSDIDNLPTNKFDINKCGKLDNCCICLEKFKNGDNIKRLPCLHIFHKNEIDKWLKVNHICPICRIPVDK